MMIRRQALWILVALAGCGSPPVSPAEVATPTTSARPTVAVEAPVAPVAVGVPVAGPSVLRMVYGVSPSSAAEATAEVMRRRLSGLDLDAGVEIRSEDGGIAVDVARSRSTEDMGAIREALERPADFFIARCDDEADPIGGYATADVPEGILLDVEQAPIGPGKRKARHFARVEVRPGETPEAAAERLAGWLVDVPVGRGRRLIVGRFDGPDAVGYRSYTVFAEGALDGAAIAEARGQDGRFGGVQLRLRLSSAGADSFAALTAANVQRRLAMVIDGRVFSAPVVMEAITGGELLVSLGRDVSFEEADRLGRLLEAGALPGRVERRSEALVSPTGREGRR